VSENVSTFAEMFESLAGHAYRVSDDAALIETVAGIVRDAGATCVALGELSPTVSEGLTRLCEAAGITVLKPPYARADLPGAIDGAQVGIGTAAYGIAQTGTLVEECTDDALRLVSSLPRTYIGIVDASAIIGTLEESSPRLRAYFESNPENATVSFISGPSRTGDIELKLTLGVHGPEHAHAVIRMNGSET
jgi:L-lactate dehydrogenase complex protein LldG